MSNDSLLARQIVTRQEIDEVIDVTADEIRKTERLVTAARNDVEKIRQRHGGRIASKTRKMSDDKFEEYKRQIADGGATGEEASDEPQYEQAVDVLRIAETGLADLRDLHNMAVGARPPIPGTPEYGRQVKKNLAGMSDADMARLKADLLRGG